MMAAVGGDNVIGSMMEPELCTVHANTEKCYHKFTSKRLFSPKNNVTMYIRTNKVDCKQRGV